MQVFFFSDKNFDPYRIYHFTISFYVTSIGAVVRNNFISSVIIHYCSSAYVHLSGMSIRIYVSKNINLNVNRT